MATVFLSYSREDVERVRCLVSAIERAGHDVWWDRHISAGDEFSGAIEQALESADIVVVVWTENSIRSAWVRDEAAAGRDSDRLVPVSFDGCVPPLGFRQYQTIDLSGWTGRPRSKKLAPFRQAIEAKASGAARDPKRPGRPTAHSPGFGFTAHRWIVAAAVLFLVAGSLVSMHALGRTDRTVPKVAMGEFVLLSAGLPRELPELLGQEMLAAFGAENAVTVVAHGDERGRSTAPFVMEGSITGLGRGVRVTVNLKNQHSGVLLWSDAYEHESADALATRQAAVGASQVTRCALWGAANYSRRMPDQALSLYLKWCNEHWSGSTSETAELDAARRVTVAVPDFSFGWSALALAAVPLAHRAGSADADQRRVEARAAARKAIALDDENPEGYMALAGLLPVNRYAEREALLKKAINVRKTECGCERQAYGDFLSSVGRMEEAVEQYELARAMRPLAPFSNVRYAQALYVVGRTDEADRILADTIQLWPQATSLRLLKMKSALWTKRYDEAIDVLRSRDLPLTSGQRQALTSAFEALKFQDPALRLKAIADLGGFASDPRRNDRLVVAMLAALGAREEALHAAARLIDSRGLWQSEVLFEPNLASARANPGYAALVRQLGLTAYWRSANTLPDICRGPGVPHLCSPA